MTQSALSAPRLSTGTKFFYGLGSIAYGIKNVAFATYLIWYYNRVIGAPAAMVSGAIMVALIFDAISDPIVGQISDRMKSKWGRRHPLMYLSAIPASVSFLLLWIPPPGLEGAALFFYLVVVATMVRTFITLYEIPSSALAPELASDYNERTSIASFRYSFGYLGYFGMSALALFFLLRPTSDYPIGQLNPEGYLNFGLIGGACMLVTILLSAVGTHHRIPYLRTRDEIEKQSVLDTFKHMISTFSHKGFLSILSFGVLKFTATGMASALSLYFYTYFWGLSSIQVAILTFEGLVAAVVAMPAAPYLSRRFGKRSGAFMLACLAVGFSTLPFILRWLGLFFENGHPMLLPTLFVTQSIYLSCGAASAMLVHAMISDVSDERSLATGRRAEGLFFAANSFMQKSTSGLGIFVAGILVTVAGLPDGGAQITVTTEQIGALAAFYVPTVIVLYVAGASFLYFYRISKEDHEANMARLAEREGAPLTSQSLDPSAEGASASADGQPISKGGTKLSLEDDDGMKKV